jgi:hypothetical protein
MLPTRRMLLDVEETLKAEWKYHWIKTIANSSPWITRLYVEIKL